MYGGRSLNGTTLYFPLNFAAKLKLLLKNVFIKTKREKWEERINLEVQADSTKEKRDKSKMGP